MKRLPFPSSPTKLKAHNQQLRRLLLCVSSTPSRKSNTWHVSRAPSASLSAWPLSKTLLLPLYALHISNAAKCSHPPCPSQSSPTWPPIYSSIAALSLAIITTPPTPPHSSASTSPLSFPMLTRCIASASRQS